MLALIKNRSRLCVFILLAIVVGIAYATTSPPKVSFVSPSNGAAISGVVKVVVTFSSIAENPVIKVELYLDRQLVEENQLSPPLLSGEQVYFLNTIRLANGPHSLVAKAYSGPNEVGESSITVYVNNGLEDITPPLVEILYPKDQQKVAGKVEVKIKAQDDREVRYVMLFINDKFKFLKNYPPYNDIWDTTRYPNGPYLLQAFAYDSAENKGESSPVRVYVDNPTGQTTLGEEKTSVGEEITPPLVITPPPVAKEEKGEALPAVVKGKGEPLEVSKEEKQSISLPSPGEKVAPPAGKGGAVVASEAGPKEVVVPGVKDKIALTINLPSKVTPPPLSTGQAVVSGAAPPKEVMKDTKIRTEKTGGVPILPPLGPAQAKGVKSAPLSAEKVAPATPEMKVIPSPPPTSKPSSAKGGATRGAEFAPGKSTDGQKPLLIVSNPEENLSLLAQGPLTLGNNYKVHTIQKGEYLFKIAKAYGVPVETLVSVNNIRNPDLVVEGQKLLIPSLTVVYNNSEVFFPDARPFVQNDLPLLPFRAVFETAGGTVIWHHDTREVEAYKEGKNIWLRIGSRKAQVNDQTILMEVAAFIKFNRTYVPATLFHYALDAEIQWDPQSGHLYISTP